MSDLDEIRLRLGILYSQEREFHDEYVKILLSQEIDNKKLKECGEKLSDTKFFIARIVEKHGVRLGLQ